MYRTPEAAHVGPCLAQVTEQGKGICQIQPAEPPAVSHREHHSDPARANSGHLDQKMPDPRVSAHFQPLFWEALPGRIGLTADGEGDGIRAKGMITGQLHLAIAREPPGTLADLEV